MWATLGKHAKITKRPTRLGLAEEGAAASIALDALSLAASESAASPLLTLDGPPSLDVALFLDGGMLYFNDDGPTLADKRARRARISWNR